MSSDHPIKQTYGQTTLNLLVPIRKGNWYTVKGPMNMNPSQFIFNELTITPVPTWPRPLKLLEFWFRIFFIFEKLSNCCLNRRPLSSSEGEEKEEENHGSLVSQLTDCGCTYGSWQTRQLSKWHYSGMANFDEKI